MNANKQRLTLLAGRNAVNVGTEFGGPLEAYGPGP